LGGSAVRFGPAAGFAALGRCLQVVESSFQGRNVGVQRFLEQRLLLGIELLALDPEFQAPQVRNLVSQFLGFASRETISRASRSMRASSLTANSRTSLSLNEATCEG
jgi:hypothetical protein